MSQHQPGLPLTPRCRLSLKHWISLPEWGSPFQSCITPVVMMPLKPLRLLDGVIDIYMPDAKYGDNETAYALSGAANYVDLMKEALREMHRQVGDLIIQDGIAERGMIIRHLVLPGKLAGTEQVMKFIAEDLSRESYVNIMLQYRPAWKVHEADPKYRAIQKPITYSEYEQAVKIALSYGLTRGISW